MLKSVAGTGTRPTADRVKEAMFSIIGPYFDGGTALDLFAGTGGLGIEALSRGMDRAIFVDFDRQCVEVIRDNLMRAGLADQAEVYRNDADRALNALSRRGLKFDLVLIDPPYRLNVVESLLDRLDRLGLLHDAATVVAEQDAARELPPSVGPLHCVRRAEYGDTALWIYRNRNEPRSELHEQSEK